MSFNVPEVVGAVVREVGRRMVDGKEGRVVVAMRSYPAAPEAVWDALTNPERIPRWFLPIEGDLRLGGHYQLQGNASGTITACEPPTRLALTWTMHGAESWVDVTLTPEGAATQLRLEHVAHVGDDLWAQMGPGAVGIGWDLSLMGLWLYLSTGKAKDDAEAHAWLASEDGRSFMRLTGQGWIDAAIAGGDPAEAAQAAGARTIAMYGG